MTNVNTEVSQGLQNIRDTSDATEAIDVLCREILQAIKSKNEIAGYDKTFRSVITAINGTNLFTIIDTGIEIPNIPAYVGSQKINVGTNVYVKIPSGNRSNMYICNVIS